MAHDSIKIGERVVFVGLSGSGKSFAAKHLLAGAPRLVVIDAAGHIEAEDSGLWGCVRYDGTFDALDDGKPARLLVPAPENDAEWERILSALYAYPWLIVYIDELYAVGPAPASSGMRRLCTRGRHRKIGVWVATQRPSGIPLYTLTEANWFFMFQLRLPEDLERMYKITGYYPPADNPLHDYNVVVYSDRTGARRYNRLNVQPMPGDEELSEGV